MRSLRSVAFCLLGVAAGVEATSLLSLTSVAVAADVSGIMMSTFTDPDCAASSLVSTTCLPAGECFGFYNYYNASSWVFSRYDIQAERNNVVISYLADTKCSVPVADKYQIVYKMDGSCSPDPLVSGSFNSYSLCVAPEKDVGGGGSHDAVAMVTFDNAQGDCHTKPVSKAFGLNAGLCLGGTDHTSGRVFEQGLAFVRKNGQVELQTFSDQRCQNLTHAAPCDLDVCQAQGRFVVENQMFAEPADRTSGSPKGVLPPNFPSLDSSSTTPVHDCHRVVKHALQGGRVEFA